MCGKRDNSVILVEDFAPGAVEFCRFSGFRSLQHAKEIMRELWDVQYLHFFVLPSGNNVSIITVPSAVASRMCPSPSVTSCGLDKGCSSLKDVLLLHIWQVAPELTIH